MNHPKIKSGLSESEIEDYMTRLTHYIVSMCFFEKMLDNNELSIDDYNDIERTLALKYDIDEHSIFRMNREKTYDDKIVEKIEL